MDSIAMPHERHNPWENIYSEGVPTDFLEAYPNFNKIVSILKEKKVHTVLDVAMGAGRHALALSKEGFEVAGFDISESALKLAEALLFAHGYDSNFAYADMFDTYPYPSDSFDGVIAIQAIYHGRESDMSFALEEINRVLKPGSPFIFTVTLSKMRSTLGARDSIIKEVDQYTYLPMSGREKGLIHFAPDEVKLQSILKPYFDNVIITEDKKNQYYMVQCLSRK